MKELNSKKEDVVATVAQNKFYWSSEDVADAYEEMSNSVSAPELTAGTWKGTFQMKINLQSEKEHEHNYVDGVCTGCGEKDPNAPHEHNYIDGKCECGAIDPNHEHNYEDGECTICGKEVDPYETAPATAYSNWNYTLDNTNNIITLNYYIGSETDVIVYANYVVGGKTYKTQIKSNDDATASTPYMFNGQVSESVRNNVKSIKFSKDIDTSNITNMSYMFAYCYALSSLDISGFNTSNVVNMSNMFNNCIALANIDVTNFNTGKVTDMSNMFNSCRAPSLKYIDVSNFDTSNVTNMAGMFNDCRYFTSLDVSNFDTSKVTNMSRMFDGLAVTSLDVSNFDTSNVTDMSYMFYGLKITSLDVSNFDTSKVTNMYAMFYGLSAITSLDLTNFDTNNVTDMTSMFCRSSKLKTIYVDKNKWSSSQAKTTTMFEMCGTSTVTYK